jgi:hypothetical protein
VSRSIRVTAHDGVIYAGQLAKIDKTELGWEDHGILSAMLFCSWDGAGIGVGGFCLDQPVPRDEATAVGELFGLRRRGTAYGLDHLMRIIETVGVTSWEALTGASVIVLFPEGNDGPGSRAVGLAGVHNDRTLVLAQHAELWRQRGELR